MMMTNIDQDALEATADLVDRSGARALQIGYLHDDVPPEDAAWYASADYQGARIIEEDHRGPIEALDALARRILTGAKCAHCGGLVALSDLGAIAYPTTAMADGTTWTAAEAARAGQCRWRRLGNRWERGCETGS